MPNAIERDVYVLRNTLKNPIAYVRGTDLLPIIFHFRDFTVPSGATATAFTAKPDGNAVYGSAVISGNDVTIDVTQQMFIVLGMSMLQVEIKEGEETLTTFIQPVMVEPNLKAGDLPESTTDVEFIDKIIEQAQEAVNDANAALETANTAISGANTAAESANSAAQNANNAAEELQDKADAGDFTASVQVGATTTLDPDQDATVGNSGTNKDAVLNFGIPKGDPGTAASIQVGTTQTVQPEENAEVTNTGTTSAAVLNFKIPRGEDGMTDLTAEYKDASEYTCQPTVNAPVILKEIAGKTEQGENPSPDNLQVIKGVGGMGYFDGEWVQGNISSTGTVGTETTGITSANAIPCKQNDNIAVTYEDSIDVIAVAFYNASGAYISTSTSGNSVDTFTATAPANAASFKVNLRVVSGSTITPNGAKYCTVTINGEYQTGVETTGAQLLNAEYEESFTLNKRFGNLQIFPGTYTISVDKIISSDTDSNYSAIYVYGDSTSDVILAWNVERGVKQSRQFTVPNGKIAKIVYVYSSDSYDNSQGDTATYYGLMLNKGSTALPWKPYHHTAISIPLTSPLYEGDKICYVKPGESYVDADGDTVVADRILYGCYRENAEAVFDGSEDEQWGAQSTQHDDKIKSFYIPFSNGAVGYKRKVKCNKFKSVESNFGINNDGTNINVCSSSENGENLIFDVSNEISTDVGQWKAWLSENKPEVIYELAQPYFEPFEDQSIFYGLRTDDTLSYVYSNDPIEPILTVEVAKNSTGGYLLESYAQAQKNAISEANSQSRLSAIEQQLVNQATTPTE